MQEDAPELLSPNLLRHSEPDFIQTTFKYFSIFNHPLHENELVELCGISREALQARLTELVANRIICKAGSYYSFSSNINQEVKDRKDKEARAILYRKRLPFFAGLISRFPYVRGVAVSGSLNKGVMGKGGDIDFFIVTVPGKLWTCRTLLILFKKIFLLNSRKYFCMNYFVDTNNLSIKDRNLFTAMEIFYLEPVFQKDFSFSEFFKKNEWIYGLIPAKRNEQKYVINEGSGPSFSERILNRIMGRRAEFFFHRITLKRWYRKFGHFSEEKFQRTMRSTEGVSKHHPRDFQEVVLNEMKSS